MTPWPEIARMVAWNQFHNRTPLASPKVVSPPDAIFDEIERLQRTQRNWRDIAVGSEAGTPFPRRARDASGGQP